MKIVILLGPYHPDMNPVSACMDKYIQVLKYKYNVEIVCIQNKYKYSEFEDGNIKIHYIGNFLLKVRNFCEYKIENNDFILFYRFIRFTYEDKEYTIKYIQNGVVILNRE